MKFIGDKVSHQKQQGVFTLVISPKVTSLKETLLLTWLLAWTFCGIFFITQLFGPDPRETKLAIGVMVAFWAYFEFKICKAFFWRKHGLERIMIKDGYLHIKNDIKGFGKAKMYFIEFMGNSFWVIAGETVGFEHLGKPVTFAQHLNDRDAKLLVRLMESELKLAKKVG
jgi:hypothetical protein